MSSGKCKMLLLSSLIINTLLSMPFHNYLDKRKTSMDNMVSQPPTKKLVTDGPTPMLSDSLSADIQGATDGHDTVPAVTDGDLSSSPQDLQNKNVTNVTKPSKREITGGQSQKTPAAPGQALKKDMDAANLLPPLFDYFGESMLFFVPSPELSFFL